MPQTMFMVNYGCNTALYKDGPLAYNGPLLDEQSVRVVCHVMGWELHVVAKAPAADGSDRGFPASGTGCLLMPEHYDQFIEMMGLLESNREAVEIQQLWNRLTELINGKNKDNGG